MNLKFIGDVAQVDASSGPVGNLDWLFFRTLRAKSRNVIATLALRSLVDDMWFVFLVCSRLQGSIAHRVKGNLQTPNALWFHVWHVPIWILLLEEPPTLLQKHDLSHCLGTSAWEKASSKKNYFAMPNPASSKRCSI